MPTGYTADVADGTVTDLRTFAMCLARGMGACVMMRDDPMIAPIPERFEPSDYNAKKLAEAKAERDRLYAMTADEAEIAAKAEYDEAVAYNNERRTDIEVRRKRYLNMIEAVEKWQGAPEGIKRFALEQLNSGMDFDCPRNWQPYRDETILSGEEWRTAALEKVAKDIEYHAAEDAKERERAEGRNAWIAQLRRSLEAQ